MKHNKRDEDDRKGCCKIEYTDCSKYYTGNTKKKIKENFGQHKNTFNKPFIYNYTFATHTINNNNQYPSITHMKLIKSIQKRNHVNIFETLEI